MNATASATATAREPERVRQFSVFTANRLGRLRDLISVLGSQEVHVLALSILDASDCSIIRFVTDDPDKARRLLQANDFPFTESELLAVELDSSVDLPRVMSALLEAEVNVNYLYSFIPHPRDKSILALSMEDLDIAEKILTRHQFRLLRQADISR
jgi:hypothetical protein